MITKIELGSFDRGESSPILLKKKIESDGSLSVRIYQRKDIDSITSFKDKIKTMMKYGIEDFCMAHETFRPLLGTVGIERIVHLQTDGLKDAQDLLQSIRSEARTGKVTQEKEEVFKDILKKNRLSTDYAINFYEGKYTDEDLFSDLENFINSDNNFSQQNKSTFESMKNDFKSKNIVTEGKRENYQYLMEKINGRLRENFDKKIRLLGSQAGEHTNSGETHFPGRNPSYLTNLQQEIGRKLNQIVVEIVQRSIIPKDEDIKKYLLQSLEEILPDDGSSRTVKKKAEICATIDILFSTSWWISENKKMDSWEKVKEFFRCDERWMPEPVRNRIYPEQEPTSMEARKDPHLDTNLYVDRQQ
jgi:hypothetical protein